MRSLLLIFAATLPLASAPADETKKHDPEAAQLYQHCILLARNSPQEGWQEGMAWNSMGGGEPARHCVAVAMITMRQFEDGATRLEELADRSEEPARIRAGMLAQAGQAWLLAKQPENAYRVQSKALELVPGAPDLLVDRAQSQAEEKNYAGALKDLDQALAVAPDRGDALTFRAAAKRLLGDLAGAKADIARALVVAPQNAEAWLEDGMQKRLAADDDGARASWQKAMELAPQSETADMAHRNIELLDGVHG
jgi:tetratricopeptide (TPR) repeat protein